MYEAYLYHFVRVDNRHNFSPHFYDLYLHFGLPSAHAHARLALACQACVVAVLGVALHADLPLAALAQTLAFVAFNKVCTAQVSAAAMPPVLACLE